MKTIAISIRIPSDVKASMAKEAKKEKKSLTKYLIDAHLSHCGTKYYRSVTCPRCDAENVRQEIVCWQCGKGY